ncbi:MAG TPA: POTRA domain-containing protein [Bryobacteraceae bacterium]|nr:POTRA domain-containing protein [Bryobacteraceae bacterium]
MGARCAIPLFLLAGVLAAQTSGKRLFPVESLAIEGNRTLGTEAILTVSGLKRGEPANSDVFDAARDRLLASGYFDTVSYRYKATTATSTPPGYDVTFTVKEIETLYPIRIDALGVSTDEIVAFLKTHDPLFTGKLPGTRQVLDRTAREIEQFLAARHQSAQVAGRVIAIMPGRFEINFTPARGLPAVSTVSFQGNKVIGERELHNKIDEVAFGQPYTEDGFRVFLENQIRPLYEAKGYMHVTFPNIASAPSKNVEGVDVNVTVNEGERYTLSKVVVGGSLAEDSREDSERLLKSAKLPRMTVVNFDQIKEGADRVRDSIRHDGFLDAKVNIENKRDDAAKTVEFVIVVEPGPEYKMGKLTVLGLGLEGEAAIRQMWAVRTGEAFPQGYPDLFVARVKEEGIFDNLGDTKADPKIDRTSHVVDVTLNFKGAGPAPRKDKRRGPVF